MNDVNSSLDDNKEVKPVNNPSTGKKNPYTIWFVVLAFVAPVTLAYIMFFFGDIKSFTNSGEILNPIIHITSFELKDENNEAIAEKDLTYKWRILSFLGKDCDQPCEAQLYDTRQIFTSLGKDRHRVIRMFVHLQPPSEELLELMAAEHANVIHVYGDEKTIVDAIGNNASITNNENYIMDPMGNVMMRFTQDQPNKDFLKDLKKLLKASQIG